MNKAAKRNDEKNINRLNDLSYNTCMKKKITRRALTVAIPIETHNSHWPIINASVNSDMMTVNTVRETNATKTANIIQTGIGWEK